MLRLRDVHASYDQVPALHGIALEVPEGKIVTVLGANRAGKSSAIRAIAGLLAVSRGSIEFDRRDIAGRSTEHIVQLGISVVPEGRQLFNEMTVRENLRLGAYTRRNRAEISRQTERVLSYFPVLGERRDQKADLLSGGEQQMLAIGRALMGQPRLLVLDEPSLGLAPKLMQDIFTIIRSLNEEEGITILLVEQNANLALGIAHYGYVLEAGKVVLEDAAEKLLANAAVREAYLGF
tara:strand:- start:323 stop:1030 length:708 start_codon:yes stop_codon:yes gene_type:complete